MKALIKNFLFIIILITIANCSNEPITEVNNDILDASQYYEALNIEYGDNVNQKFDLYLPENRSNTTKTVILVHGGGWISGDKSEMNPIKDLIRQDFPDLAIVNINYTLADENNKPYPMQINDITSVINHLQTNKTKYTISNDIGFIGTSAGAHLSLLWSYAFDPNKKVNMVCSIVGPTNFTDPEYLNNTNPYIQELLDLYGENPTTAFLEEVSPYHQVTATAPPTILFYGGQDPLIPTTQGTVMRDKLSSLGVTHEFILYPNAGHGWDGLDLLDTWVKLKAFTTLYLY